MKLKQSSNGKILVYIFMCSLVFANFFLLYSNVKIKKNLSILKEDQVKNYPFLNYDLSSTVSIIHPDVILKEEGVSLSIFIPENSCASCLEFEIPNINEFYIKNSERTEIYIIGKNNVIDDFNTDFQYNIISNDQAIFDKKISFSNPLAVLLDSKGKVYDFYIAETNKSGKSYNFYQRMDSFFKEVN
ncbi:MAG: hypothetical protein FH748_11170 [Balneolaceae bacterium]|nr:hypothetical protein [Balneolaceae bacterium]